MTRHIRFDGIDNFRDFGDYAAGGGVRRLHKGRLYRSGNPSAASDADLARLAGMGIGAVIDLRRSNERERQPSRRWDGFHNTVLIENDIGQESADEWSTFITSSDLSQASFHAYMMDYYRKAPFQVRHIDLYRRYFRALAETDGAILVHCAAGKDRTGIICALTHHIAGVHEDDIRADYLLTNEPERLVARLPMIRQAIRDATGKVADDDALMTCMRVEAEYLDEAFAVMTEQSGSIDAYLERELGVDDALRARLHDRLVG